MEPGTKLGPYEVTEQLGAGGMGEVWLAEDTRLGRRVAVKVLPEDLASDEERLARFEQEARAAAALNHPHIAVVHDIGTAGETRFMVQEHLEGTTLREPLDKGALPLKRALTLATEIAEALTAAHAAGITHRDLKPENIFVTNEGHSKILDFGLAKLTEGTLFGSGAGSASMSPTRLGTAGYMAPEQVEGAPDIDSRADVFAFGCLLYEMATGGQPFAGKNVVQTLDRIVNEEPPPLVSVAPELPERLAWILGKCLAKEPGARYQAASDLAIDLRALSGEVEAGTARSLASVSAAADSGRTVPLSWAAGLAAALLVVVAVLGWQLASRPTAPAAVARLTLPLPDGLYLASGMPIDARLGGHRPSRTAIALSPDGGALVFAATDGETRQLYLRSIADGSTAPIAGTEGGVWPFFSPDGTSVGYVDTEAGALRTIPVNGGPSRVVLELASSDGMPFDGAQWTADGSIVFTDRTRIWRVSDRGGEPEQLKAVARDRNEYQYVQPRALPDSDALLYIVKRANRNWASADVVAYRLGEEDHRVLFSNASDMRYLSSGHLLFARDGALWAVRFDARNLVLVGEPQRVADDLMHAIGGANDRIDTGAAQYTTSESGMLAFARGGTYDSPNINLVWVSPDGGSEPLPMISDYYLYPRLSPDDRYLALRSGGVSDADIGVLELATGALRRLRLEGAQVMPVWSADGDRLAFTSNHDGRTNVATFSIGADLAGPPELQIEGVVPSSWSRDGVLLAVGGGDIWALDTRVGGEPIHIVDAEGRQEWPDFSPDGTWFAYASDHTGTNQIYARPYPAGQPEYPVTAAGGTRPVWSRDGRRLYYRTGLNDRSRMMVVEFTDADPPRWSEPRELFDRPYLGTSNVRSYDVARDGRVLLLENFSHAEKRVTEIEVVINAIPELERMFDADQ